MGASAQRTGNALHDLVVELSESNTWVGAAVEWGVSNMVDMDQPTYECLCGKKGVRYIYTIRNMKTGAQIDPVGSECIHKFGKSTRAYEELDVFSVLSRTREQLLSGEPIQMKSPFFTKRALKYMLDDGAFPGTSYNDGNGANDHKFLLHVFNKRHVEDLTERQVFKYRRLMDDTVKPYLLTSHKFGGLAMDDDKCIKRFSLQGDYLMFKNVEHASALVTHMFNVGDPSTKGSCDRVIQGMGDQGWAVVSGDTQGPEALARYEYTLKLVTEGWGGLCAELFTYTVLEPMTHMPMWRFPEWKVDADAVLEDFFSKLADAGVGLNDDVLALHTGDPGDIHLHRIFDPRKSVSLRGVLL